MHHQFDKPEVLFPYLPRQYVEYITVDQWLAQDSRIRASIHIAPQDPALAVAEIERLADNPAFVQVLMPAGARMPFGNRFYHPIYAACEAHGLPVCVHFGAEGAGISAVRLSGAGVHCHRGRPGLEPTLSLFLSEFMATVSTMTGQSRRPALRIAFVLSSLQLSGGVWLVIECANQLVRRGHRVSFVVPGGTIDRELARQINPAIQVIESAARLTAPRSPLALLKLTGSLARATPPADILIATHTPTLAPAWLAGRLLGRGRLAWLYMDYPRMFERRPLEGWLLQHGAAWLDLILPISQPLADMVARQTRAPVVVVRSGLPRAAHFFDQPRLLRADGLSRVLYVGDDRPRKGLQEFLRAADLVHPQHPNTKFVIAAKNPCTITLAAPHEFHLRPTDEGLSALYRSSDLYVSASWGEGLGYPPLEAMACGTPVVLSDSEGVRDYAVHEENCLLVPARDVDGLAAAMLRLLGDPALAARLAHNGLHTARRYTWEAMTDCMEEAFTLL